MPSPDPTALILKALTELIDQFGKVRARVEACEVELLRMLEVRDRVEELHASLSAASTSHDVVVHELTALLAKLTGPEGG
jgi:hypothetical protein